MKKNRILSVIYPYPSKTRFSVLVLILCYQYCNKQTPKENKKKNQTIKQQTTKRNRFRRELWKKRKNVSYCANKTEAKNLSK